MFAYCSNDPVMYVDPTGAMAVEAGVAVSNFWNPVGWIAAVILVAEVVVTVVAVDVAVDIGTAVFWDAVDYIDEVVEKKETSDSKKYNPDPYARPGQKKQGREPKNKNREKENFLPRNNRRDGKPAPPKHHTSARDHQKYSQSKKTKLDMLYIKLG